jgi:carboxypeptidase C (cathepsin A)
MYKDFGDDISRSFKNQLERVIEADVNVLIYNGQNDMIINTPGVLTYLNTLQWKYSKQWKASPKKVWRVGN